MRQETLVKLLAPTFPAPTWVLKHVLPRMMKKAAHAQGMGRHSREEVLHLGYLDLEAMSAYLGKLSY